MIGLFTTIGLIVLIIWFFVYNYNNLIHLKNRANEAFSGIDVQLKKRYDLIPNPVSAVKAYMVHERGVLEEITARRSYNAMARSLNDAVGMFPSSIFASFMNIKERNYIEIPETESHVPNVGAMFNL